jgi:hypothetical protein
MDLYDFCAKSVPLLLECDASLHLIQSDTELLVSAAQVVSEVSRLYDDQVTDAHLAQVTVAAALIERMAEDISERVFRIMGKLKTLEAGIDAMAEWLSQQEKAEEDELVTEQKGRVQ